MAHAKGSNVRIVAGFEDVFNQLPDDADGIALPYNTIGLKAEQALKTPGTMAGRRDPAEPYAGFINASGDGTMPLDANAFGFWLKALLGAPVSTRDAAINIDAGDAVDKGGGLVGIPVTGHGIPAGATVTIAGTANYNGDEVVHASSSANEIVIAATYAAETFSGGTVQAKLYTHVYKIQDEQPSFWIEKQFQDISQYEVITGCKVGGMGLRVGGDNELVGTLNILGCNALALAGTSAVDTVTTMALARFLFDGASIYEGGALYGKATEVSLDVNADLDGDVYPIGNGGMRASLPEGIMSIGGSMKAIFENAALLEKGRAHADTSIKLRFSRTIESLELECQEVQFSRTSVTADTPKGLYANVNWQAFYRSGAANSALVATLRNQIASY